MKIGNMSIMITVTGKEDCICEFGDNDYKNTRFIRKPNRIRIILIILIIRAKRRNCVSIIVKNATITTQCHKTHITTAIKKYHHLKTPSQYTITITKITVTMHISPSLQIHRHHNTPVP